MIQEALNQDRLDTRLELGCQHPVSKASLMLAFYSGLRPGELCALALENIAPDLRSLTVRRRITRSGTFEVPKNDNERTVLLFPPAQEALKGLIADAKARNPADLRVWLNRNESRIDRVRLLLVLGSPPRKSTVKHSYALSAWGNEWRNILRRAGIRPPPPYPARHTYACWSLAAGGNLAFVAAQTGHADYLPFIKTYGRWIKSASLSELQRTWETTQNLGEFGTFFCPRKPKQKT